MHTDLTMGNAKTQVQRRALMGLLLSVQMVKPNHKQIDQINHILHTNHWEWPNIKMYLLKAAPQLQSQCVQTTLMWSFSELRGDHFD